MSSLESPAGFEAEGVDLLPTPATRSSGYSAVGSRYPASSATATFVGLIGIGDGKLKTDAAETVQRIKRRYGITPVMITGDNERTAQAVAEEVGIERVMADVLPDEEARGNSSPRRR